MGGWAWRRSEGGCGGRRDFNQFDDFAARFASARGWGKDFGSGIHIDFDIGRGGLGDGDGEGGGRGRRGRMFGSGELRLLLLKLIADEPRHGYDLIRAIESMTEGAYTPSPGVIYPTLTLLQDMGAIEEGPSEGARKPFKITVTGREELEQRADDVARLVERLEGHGSARARRRSPHLGRAMANLMAALKTRVGQDGWDEALVHEITAILDEAAGRIERVK